MIKQNIDIFAISVLNSLLVAIPTEMGEVLRRTSYHPIFNEVLDFSTAIMDANGGLMASSSGVVVHLGALELSTKAIINHFGKENLYPGDIMIHNNPYPGGTHLPDIDMVMPIFHDNEIIGFSVARGHHGDIGGANAGSFAGNSTSIFQEGIRIPPTKLYEKGVLNQAWIDLLLANVRVPSFTWGDLQAQISGCRIGNQRLIEMYCKYGREQMLAVQAWLMDYSEKCMRNEIAKIPDGEYVFEDYLDNDGVVKDVPVKIHVKITVKGDNITFDFSGSDKQVRGPANCVYGVVCSATYGAFFGLTDPAIPKNHGCYRPLTIIAPEGLVVNAKFPSPVVSGNTETALRIMDTINGALARVIPDKVFAADSGTATAHIAGGYDERNQEFYAWYLGSDACAWGARATKDGFTCAGGPRTGGHVCQIPMEVFETRYPFMVDEYAFVNDSGGPGRMRGGVSGVMRIRPVRHNCEIGGANDRAEIAPYGLFGGMPGLHGSNKVIHHDGSISDISRAGGIIAKAGETIIFQAPGGGGYGDPLDRKLEYLQHDIDNGYVSVDAAMRDYGAMIGTDGKIDATATETKRKLLKEEWKRDELFIDQMTKPYTLKSLRQLKMDAKLD